ncbi:MAG: NUDIX domain-containing protein [Roseibium sp.]|uniref:NUDIX hydrolase n=1 Tax=Roseibium sp. TaxID=1936156 RepID=UPI00329764FF
MSDHRQNIIVTTDVVLFTIKDDRLHVLLHQRPNEPCKGEWALPGGYIRTNEDKGAEAAAERIMIEKIGLPTQMGGTPAFYMEQLSTWSGPDRDKRGFSVSVVFLILVPEAYLQTTFGHGIALLPVDELPDLAFDHGDMVAAAMKRLRGKSTYSSLPAMLLPETFTMADLQKAYEIATGAKLNTSAFTRKIMALDMIVDTGEVYRGPGARGTRPAKLWRLADGRVTFDRTLA